jgi:tetratricopeptide (TPR) repeat protein
LEKHALAQEIGLAAVCDDIGSAFSRGDLQRVEMMLHPAIDQYPDQAQLWFYAGNLYFQQGKVALSVACFEKCIALDSNAFVMANLGAALRRLNKNDAGAEVLRRCLERKPDYEPALINLGSMYVNEGTPDLGIPYLERAVAIGNARGTHEKGDQWNLGLLYLEAARFREGFDLYRTGLGHERQSRTYGYTLESRNALAKARPELFEQGGLTLAPQPADEPEWLQPEHKGEGKTLIVYGEQGIGDELMIGTLLEQAREEFSEVIFECHPRLLPLHQAAHPGMRIFPTRKDSHILWPITEGIQADYKAPVFDLASRYRQNLDSFLRGWDVDGPVYHAPDDEALEYRDWLDAVAEGRPIVGLATRGGVINTARTYRTLGKDDIDRLFKETDALFVSLDYDDMSAFAAYIDEAYPGRYLWQPSIVQHWDYHHVAALIAATDLTVTVCQSAFHMSAGMGHPTVCLTPKRCAWRYATIDGQPELSYWYPSEQVRLYRQQDDTWTYPVTRAIERIKAISDYNATRVAANGEQA